MNRVRVFFSEMYTELTQKVSWPTWEELQASMIVVTTATLLITLMVWLMNEASNFTMSTFYHLFE